MCTIFPYKHRLLRVANNLFVFDQEKLFDYALGWAF